MNISKLRREEKGSVLIEAGLAIPVLLAVALWFYESIFYNRAMIQLNYVAHSVSMTLSSGLGGRGISGSVSQQPQESQILQAYALAEQSHPQATSVGAGRNIISWKVYEMVETLRLPIKIDKIDVETCVLVNQPMVGSRHFIGTITIEASYLPKTKLFMNKKKVYAQERVRIMNVLDPVSKAC